MEQDLADVPGLGDKGNDVLVRVDEDEVDEAHKEEEREEQHAAHKRRGRSKGGGVVDLTVCPWMRPSRGEEGRGHK